MKDLFLAVVLISLVMEKGLAAHHEPQVITVRTSIYDTRPYPSFIKVPISTSDYKIEDYEQLSLEDDFSYSLDLYCLCNDPRFCLFFDRKGQLAGIQISYPTSDLQNIDPEVYNISNPNFINTNFYDIEAKSVRMYITNPENLLEEGRRDSSRDLVEGLWSKIDGVMVKYDSKCQPNSPLIGDFNVVGCAPKLGQLYLRRFSENDQCQDGFFLHMVYEGGRLVGFGHTIPGMVSPGPKVDISIYPNGTTFQELITNPPPCFYEMAQYGFTAVSLWMIEDPWNIRCPKCLCN